MSFRSPYQHGISKQNFKNISSNSSSLSLPPTGWSIDSWETKPIHQQPEYQDQEALRAAISQVRALPSLVHPNEIRELRSQLAEVAQGKRFLLQGGDCAERFADCTSDKITAKLKILLQMSLVITWGARMPTVKLGRVAGQYGKPRSSPTEKLSNGEIVNSFKGDNVNSFEADKKMREHDPSRLVTSHFYSATTLNYIRAIIKGGFADLYNLQGWDLDQFKSIYRKERYEAITRRISDSLDFMDSIGMDTRTEQVKQVDFFVSHEGLLLNYEAACTTKTPEGEAYDLSAHFLWIGERTRQLDSAHVEFFRGIANPIGIKIGPTTRPDDLIKLLNIVNPTKEVGKITLISRFGAKKVETVLPSLIAAVHEAGYGGVVIWSCDPMHGNTYSVTEKVPISTSSDSSTDVKEEIINLKTRAFDDILEEVRVTFNIHRRMGSFLGGIHFELTGEHVTECVGGPEELVSSDLPRQYTTYCDPRLNYSQSLSMSFCLADLLRDHRETGRSIFGPKRFNNSPLLTPSSSVQNLAGLDHDDYNLSDDCIDEDGEDGEDGNSHTEEETGEYKNKKLHKSTMSTSSSTNNLKQMTSSVIGDDINSIVTTTTPLRKFRLDDSQSQNSQSSNNSKNRPTALPY